MDNRPDSKIKLLIIDDEKEILRMLEKLLNKCNYDIITAESGEEAMELLETYKDEINLVITDYLLPNMNGIDVLINIRSKYSLLPVIMMTAFGNKELVIEAIQHRCDGFIEKPFDFEQFLSETVRVLAETRSIRQKYESMASTSDGVIQGISLPTFLQAVATEEKNWTLTITSGDKNGKIYFLDGDLVDAGTENLTGEEAALEIISWEDAVINIHNGCDKKRTIESSLKYILFESLRRRDEVNTEAETSYDLLEKAVWLAHGRHFKDSRRILKKVLEKEPRSHNAWLWYSRVVKKIKNVEAALTNAIKISPDNIEIKEEIEKIEIAKTGLELEKGRRCPFCWTPVNENALQCPYCKGNLSIHNGCFKPAKGLKDEFLKEAIERFKRVSAKEENINVHYYCSMAYLNLGILEESLKQLHLTISLAPKNNNLLSQMQKLLDHMDSIGMNIGQVDDSEHEGPDLVRDSKTGREEKKILVVEDSSTTRKVISVTLSRKGYSIVEAGDGLEALSKVEEEKPDLVLLDIILPKMDGYKVLSIIKNSNDFKHIPVIMLTSKDAYHSRIKGELAGSAAYLTKPFDTDQLVGVIEDTLLSSAAVPAMMQFTGKAHETADKGMITNDELKMTEIEARKINTEDQILENTEYPDSGN